VRKRFCSERVTAAKESLQRKSHCSERATAAKVPLQRKCRCCSERATAAKDAKSGKNLPAEKSANDRLQRKCVESSQKPESTWYNQELSKYGRVSRCGLNAHSCSGVNAIALIKLSWLWPAECAYMCGHMCTEYSPSVH